MSFAPPFLRGQSGPLAPRGYATDPRFAQCPHRMRRRLPRPLFSTARRCSSVTLVTFLSDGGHQIRIRSLYLRRLTRRAPSFRGKRQPELRIAPHEQSCTVLSGEMDGQPSRLGFGKASDRYERAKSSNSVSFPKILRSLIRVLTVQDLAAGHRPFISTQAFFGLSEVFG